MECTPCSFSKAQFVTPGGGARDNFVTESKVFGNVSFIDRERLSVPEKSGEKFQKSFAKFGLH